VIYFCNIIVHLLVIIKIKDGTKFIKIKKLFSDI